MSETAIEGVVAAGRVPTWVIPTASIPTEPTEGTNSVPLAALTGASSTKIDCYYDFGDVSVSRSPQTKSRQRACQTVAQTIKIGETIDVTISAVYDQQAAAADAVNKAYSALPEGTEVYIAQAFGHEAAVDPTSATKIDLMRGTVQFRMKNQPTSPEEDLKFTATISVSGYWEDVALTGA